jgi:hypothetical protein
MNTQILKQTSIDYDMSIEDVMRIHDNFDDSIFYEKLEEFCRERKLSQNTGCN